MPKKCALNIYRIMFEQIYKLAEFFVSITGGGDYFIQWVYFLVLPYAYCETILNFFDDYIFQVPHKVQQNPNTAYLLTITILILLLTGLLTILISFLWVL